MPGGEGEGMEMATAGAEASLPCCVSHAFLRSAAGSPGRTAVVHAAGGLRLLKATRAGGGSGRQRDSPVTGVDGELVSLSPPMYPGDERFAFADVLNAVDSLSCRIRRVLDGLDDPDLVRPGGMDGHTKSSSTEDHGMPQIVGVYIPPSVEYIVAVLSVLRCGEAFLPLDPLWPEERIHSVVTSSKTALVIRSAPFPQLERTQLRDTIDSIEDWSSCPVLYFNMKVGLGQQFHQCDLAWPCESKIPRRFCYLMYTSGSTGKPKGVCGTEKGLLNRFCWMEELVPFCLNDISLFKTSISFIDHLQEFLCAILTGTALIIPPFAELMADPICVFDLVQAYHISRLTSVPSLMRAVLPSLERWHFLQSWNSLKVLILSGEILSISLWTSLQKILPETTILNLYGSTEVSGDCTYFDCKTLPGISEADLLSSVPIGVPISNCEIALVGDPEGSNEGEIYVGGACLFTGYFGEPVSGNPTEDNGTPLYFKTGDFARRLQSGDLVFLGRKDRTIKVNGQRVALEEIEHALQEHPEVIDAAVVPQATDGVTSHLEAFYVTKMNEELKEEQNICSDENHFAKDFVTSMRSWLVRKLPPVMIPSDYFCFKSLPTSASGKIDYAKLASLEFIPKRQNSKSGKNSALSHDLQIIKEVFRDALHIKEVSDNDDFFILGGNSISAAHVAYKLGIDMRLLYIFPSPCQLLSALLDRNDQHKNLLSSHEIVSNTDSDSRKKLKVSEKTSRTFDKRTSLWSPSILEGLSKIYTEEKVSEFPVEHNGNHALGHLESGNGSSSIVNSSKIKFCFPPASRGANSSDGDLWVPIFDLPNMCSFGRCNKLLLHSETELNRIHSVCLSVGIPRHSKGRLQELWKVLLKSCVDASPLIVCMDGSVYLFIGSHSYIFLCINAFSGVIRWEVTLGGRIECSAAVTGDFSQVVVGCYDGKIYFLHLMTGSISWAFQTDGEVKMQPVVDKHRNLIWCGSHDHCLYGLDYKEHCCVYKVPCGGSIYGSPSLDLVHNMIFVASTSGRVTAISLEVLPFGIAWLYEAGVPIFGSLTKDSLNGNVICCLVDGQVIALNSRGGVVWKAVVGGPIFAGACISSVLPTQVLICCRNGSVYSFDLEGGLLWEYNVGDPITSSVYVDEQTQLISEPSQPSDRWACICSSSGSIHVIRIKTDANPEKNNLSGLLESPMVQCFATMDLPGDIFSSPVMIGGRIFVGCRDDYVHCIAVVP